MLAVRMPSITHRYQQERRTSALRFWPRGLAHQGEIEPPRPDAFSEQRNTFSGQYCYRELALYVTPLLQ